MTATHPTDRELGEFLLGKLDDSGVESHLAECDSCRDRAVAVQADDTFTELLAAARTRFDSQRMSAPTPTLDGAATPPAFASTLAWAPGADATGLAPDIPAALAGHPKYRPIRRLGTGGMGTVWLAEHQVMHRPVAIKVIRPDLLARPGATNRFLREVRAAAKLHHPNIVTAFDADPAGDSYLMVMEYVPGETLGERLGSGPLPVVEALRAVRDAARGLAHAHAHGLIHRDIKPHNLIRSADGSTKVLDFGLAGVAAGEAVTAAGDGLTGAGMVVGTPDYIAPEQIADPHAADARADVYGLGCTLYHLLAGRSPMPDGSVMEKLSAQRTRPMDPIPGLPAAVAAVLAKMTAKDPNERYQSADEVVAALERCIRMVDTGHQCQRLRARVAAGLFAIGLLITAGVVFKIQRDNQEITVTTNDDDIEVVMKRKGDVLRVVDKKTGKEWMIDTAKNEIAAAETPEGLTVKLPDSEPFVLRRNGKDVFTVTRITTTPAVAKPAASPPGGPRLVRTIDHRHPVRDIAWTPDGQSVVAVGGGLCRYDVVKGRSGFEYRYEVLSGLPGLKGAKLNTEGPTQMVVSPDGQTAVIVYANMLGQFSLADGKALGFQQIPDQDGKPPTVTALAVSPDGRTAACAAGESLVFHDLGKDGPPEQVRLIAPGAVVSLRYSPDGGLLVAAAAHPVGSRTELIVLDAKTRQVVGRHTLAGMLGRVDISDDDQRLVAAGGVGDRGGFTVLTLPDLKVLQQEAEVAGFVEAARLSADGKVLTLERAPGAVEVWDVERKLRVSDQPLPADPQSAAGNTPVRHVAIAPDGRSVAVARGTEISIWELPATPAASPPAPRLVRTIEEERRFPQTPAFTPDGKTLLVAGYNYFAMYDPATGKELFSDKYPSATVNTLLAVSADGRTAAVACGNIFLYDLAARKRVATIDMESRNFVQIDALTLSPDGQRLAYVAGREVAYYDRATGQTEYTRPDDDKVRVFALRYSPDGRYLAVASRVEADQSTRVSLLDAKTRELVGRHETASPSGATLQFSRDGGQLFVAGTDLAGTELVRRSFLVLAIPSAKEVEREPRLAAGPEAPVPSPDGRLLALTGSDGIVQIRDRGQTGATFAWNPHTHLPPEFRTPPGRKEAPPRTGIAFSPDGRTLVTARGDQVRIWALAPAAAKSDHDLIQGNLRGKGAILADIERRIDPANTDGKSLPFALLEHNGAAALRFGKWLVVFEGVPCDSHGKVLFGVGSFALPEAGGPGSFVDPGLRRPAPPLRQQSTGRGNVVSIGRYQFQLEGKGTRLKFADRTYEATDPVQTIVIAPDGTTRVEAAPMAADRAAAEYVLSVGGTIRVDDQERQIKAIGDLPKEPFRLTHVVLTDNRKVTDAGLAAFKDCTHLVQLFLGKTAVTDAGLAHVKGCWNLAELELADTKVTDAGLAAFAGCRGLRHLDLDGCTSVTDAGLAHFQESKKLRAVYLFDTAVTDAGLASLKDCANLEVLGVGETRVGDAGLTHLRDCKRLTNLMLNTTQVTDRGLEVIAGYKDLTHLSLQDTKVSDAGVARLKACDQLVVLDLNATGVTDAGLKHLAGLTKLERLFLRQTVVTAAGVAELAKALPKCRIEWDGGAVGPPPKN